MYSWGDNNVEVRVEELSRCTIVNTCYEYQINRYTDQPLQ